MRCVSRDALLYVADTWCSTSHSRQRAADVRRDPIARLGAGTLIREGHAGGRIFKPASHRFVLLALEIDGPGEARTSGSQSRGWRPTPTG